MYNDGLVFNSTEASQKRRKAKILKTWTKEEHFRATSCIKSHICSFVTGKMSTIQPFIYLYSVSCKKCSYRITAALHERPGLEIECKHDNAKDEDAASVSVW